MYDDPCQAWANYPSLELQLDHEFTADNGALISRPAFTFEISQSRLSEFIFEPDSYSNPTLNTTFRRTVRGLARAPDRTSTASSLLCRAVLPRWPVPLLPYCCIPKLSAQSRAGYIAVHVHEEPRHGTITTALRNKTISLDTSHGPIILVQGSDSPWALDLNTLVTIVLGVICIALQASQIYFERAPKKRTVEPLEDDIENGGERLLAHRQEAQFTTWRRPYSPDELEEYQGPEAARGQPASAMPTRGGPSRQVFRRDDGVQAGETGYFPPGYAYRRTPWQNNERVGGPSPRLNASGPAAERRFAQRRQPGFA